MRIIAGQHRGTILADVGKGDAAAHLRPTSDRVRENLFNILLGGRFGQPVVGAKVLDLFAGTGALGLEALSRGAAHVTFVENGKVGGKLIRYNIRKLGRASVTKILTEDATQLGSAGEACSLIFLDPPYGKNLGTKALLNAADQGWIAENALIVWEEASAQLAPRGFTQLDQRRYGDTWITILQKD